MAGYRGLPPKDEADRVNKIPKRFDKTEIKADAVPKLRGPDLPSLSPNGHEWCDRTLEWWETWRKSPQAKLLGNTDWETMFEAAFLHNELWRPRIAGGYHLSPTAVVNYLSELRRRVAAFGATWEDRQKLQLSITSPLSEEEDDEEIAAEAAAAVDYMTRLNEYAAKQLGD